MTRWPVFMTAALAASVAMFTWGAAKTGDTSAWVICAGYVVMAHVFGRMHEKAHKG
jgi:hypothetical protein